MDIEQAKRTGDEAQRLLAEILRPDFQGVNLLNLERLSGIPRNTIRRKLEHGTFTVAELYRIAPHIGGNVLAWTAQLETRLAERTTEKVPA